MKQRQRPRLHNLRRAREAFALYYKERITEGRRFLILHPLATPTPRLFCIPPHRPRSLLNETQLLREDILHAYGNKCKQCKTTKRLQIDHINNQPERYANGNRLTGATLYRLIKAQGYPKDKYQLLCQPCNLHKSWNEFKERLRKQGLL